MKPQILLLPGWQDSGPAHWQSRWQVAYGYHRVQQHDWMRPLRGDWMMQLEEVVLAMPAGQSAVLVAHSLGCHLVAAWAKHSRNARRVAAALLVAPPDTERDPLRTLLPSWAPMVRQPLPFQSIVLISRDDPYCAWAQAETLARDWNSEPVDLGTSGHVNAESALGLWPDGHNYLQRLLLAVPESSSE